MGARDLPHALTAVLLATLAFGSSSVAQGAGLPPNLQRLQDAALAAERRARFFELWEAAPGSLRDAAATALARLAPDGRRLDGWPGVEELALAMRVLEGGTLVELQADPLLAFADAIGLLVVPGVAGVDPERGEPLTVRVHQTRRLELDGELELSLFWVAPDGSEERARREPFPAQAFLRGFPMYIRAPRASGSWLLVPEVTRTGRSVRGFGVPFETLPELPELAPEASLRERLEHLRTFGVRRADGVGPRGWVRPAASAASGTRGVLLVATGRDEDPDSFSHGPGGERWQTLASELELELVVLPAADVASQLAVDQAPTYLLARGDAVSELHLALFGQDVSLAGMILSTSMARPGPALPQVPTLLVGPALDVRDDPAGLQRVVGGPTPFLTEPELAQLVAPWLREQLAR